MNILIITQLLPYPLTSGGAQAQYNMIDQLRHNHHIALLYVEDRNNLVEAAHQLQKRWDNVKFIPFTLAHQMRCPHFLLEKAQRAFNLCFRKQNTDFQASRILDCYGLPLYDNSFKTFVLKHLQAHRTDLVELDFFPCLPLVSWFIGICKTVFVHHEIRFVRNRRMLETLPNITRYHTQLAQLQHQEIDWLNLCDHIITLTEKDAQVLQQQGVCTPISVSPAAVNTLCGSFHPFRWKVSFLGGAGHAPNWEGLLWFVNEIFPLLSPDLKASLQFNVIGKGWENFIAPDEMHFTSLGFVENLQTALSGSVMIIPLLSGSGMRMKILESAALQIPFLTTAVGVEGLDFQHEKHCLIADSPAAFAEALTRLVRDEHLQARFAQSAAQLYEKKYSVHSLATLRQQILESIGQL